MEIFERDYAKSRLSQVYTVLPSIHSEKYIDEMINITSGQPGTTTLFTEKFGRGEDFQVSATVNENRGLVVIQSFLSLNKNDEVQIQLRTARKQSPGEYYLYCDIDAINKKLKTEFNKVQNIMMSTKKDLKFIKN